MPFKLVIHGGAGSIAKPDTTEEQDQRSAPYRQGLQDALDAGYAILQAGGSAVDAVEAAVMSMEDNELFNAGNGAVYTAAKTQEMEALIADGRNKKIGVVTLLQHVKNPISAAKQLLLHSNHNFLSAAGAEKFAADHGCEIVDSSYFASESRVIALEIAQEQGNKAMIDHTGQSIVEHEKRDQNEYDGHGTVGAVAVDSHGNVASATSTGGMTNKSVGRIGDTPINGSGGYADNATAAVSATGFGEYIMRAVLSYDVCARMAYKHIDVQTASDEAISKFGQLGKEAEAGLIAVTANGDVGITLNSAGMYRGIVDEHGVKKTAVWREDWR